MKKKPNLTRAQLLEALVYASPYEPGEITELTGIAPSTLRNGVTGLFDLSEDKVRKLCKLFGAVPERVLALPGVKEVGNGVDQAGGGSPPA